MQEVGAKDLRAKQIVFYAIVRGVDEEDRTAYLRHLNPMKLAKPGVRFLEFGDTLSRLESPVFVMDDKFDLIIRPEEIAILDATFFLNLFYSVSGIDERIDNMVEEALANLPIDEDTEVMLVDLCRGRKRYQSKLAKIVASGHMGNVNMKSFRAALRQHKLPVRRFIRDGSIHAGKNDGELLLAILNQDLFKGCLTGEPYAAGSKRKMNVA